MKIEFEVTYDAGKLAKEMPKIIKDFLGNSAVAFEIGSKKAIEGGKFDKIGEFTKIAREKGLSPNAGKKGYHKTSSTKPLNHSGELLKSIKAFPKSQTLRFLEYGKHHLGKGVVTARGQELLDQFIKDQDSKDGIAYKIAKNNFSERFGLVGKSVPIRFWLQYDEKTGKSGFKKFADMMSKSFQRSMSLKFTRFKG